MIFDSHIHTEVSADSEMKAAQALARAEELGVGLVFTEHEDMDFPGEKDFTFSPDAYWEKYESLRGGTLRLGVEIFAALKVLPHAVFQYRRLANINNLAACRLMKVNAGTTRQGFEFRFKRLVHAYYYINT